MYTHEREKEGERYLDQPGEEEDECDEVEVGAPAWEAVDGAVHEEHPPLLGCRLIHRKYAGAWEGTERERERVFTILR